MEELLRQLIRHVEEFQGEIQEFKIEMRDFKSEMLGFKSEMLEFKSDTTSRLERMERKLDATFEQVVANTEDMTSIKSAAAQISNAQQ